MKRTTDFMDIVAKFENANFPLWDYMELDKITDVDHWLKSCIKQFDWCKNVFENALERTQYDSELKKQLQEKVDNYDDTTNN